MVRTAALISMALAAAQVVAQPLTDSAKRRLGRDTILAAADDDKLKDSKVIIGITDAGSRWMARAIDLADAWRTGGKYPHVWVFVDHSKDRTQKARETRMRVAVQCHDQLFAVLSIIKYRADGTIIVNDNFPDVTSTYTPIAPETMAEAIQRELCPLYP